MRQVIILAFLGIILLIGCKQTTFKHSIVSGSRPWSAEPTGRSQGQFNFAIVSDLNGEERDSIFDIAAAQINLLMPEFVISVGDLIDGGTEDTTQLRKEFDSFDARASKIKIPFFHAGGNHDLTNTTMRKFWKQRYGHTYYHFLYQNVLFLIIDSEDYPEERMQEIYLARKRAIELLDSGKTEQAKQSAYFKMNERISGEIGNEQSAYFEKVIAENPEARWTFLFMHKPVWKREGDGNLSRMEAALGARNYTVINGHFHEYSHTIRNNRDYIMLGTTGGGQDPQKVNAFDHITLISFQEGGPIIANLKLSGILDKTAKIPLNGEAFCFQAAACRDTLR